MMKKRVEVSQTQSCQHLQEISEKTVHIPVHVYLAFHNLSSTFYTCELTFNYSNQHTFASAFHRLPCPEYIDLHNKDLLSV